MDFIKYKDFIGSVKDVDTSKRKVTGYFAHFGSKDSDGDIITDTAFNRTVKERGPEGSNQIMFLNQHDWKQPHGFLDVLKTDSTGLYFESKALPNTSYSNDAIVLYQEGIVKEHSIGYNVINNDRKSNANYLTELKLWEGSNVTLGANSNTPFTGFKSLNIQEVNEKTNSIIKLIKNGTLTDETFIQLEIALKQLQQHAYELGKKHLDTTDTSNENQDVFNPQILDTLKSINNSLITK